MMVSAQNDPRHAGTIWAIDLHQSRPSVTPPVSAEFRQLGPASAEWLASIMGAPSVEEVRRRFRSGGRCYTVWVDGHLASYGWVSFDEEYVGEFNLRVRLLPGEAYVWDCFTLPAYRRHGLYSALLAHVLCDLEAGPVCRAWIGADADNVASQRGIARAGFQAVADMVLARVLAIRLVWVQGRPGMPEGAVAEARRAFLDNRDSVWLKAIERSKELAPPAGQPSDLHPSETRSPDQVPLQGAPRTADDPTSSHFTHS